MQHSDPLQHLDAELAELERRDLLRRPPPPADPRLRSFCSNDYLGLAADPPPPAPSGSGASRLIAGERAEHRELEQRLASWTGTEDALVFSSGYAANVGVLSALASPGDLIVSDALNHASIIDGSRLSRARIAVVPHLDVGAVRAALRTRETGRAWVVVESYYSMDADGPDLAQLRGACDEAGAALLVDEAHALGVLGPGGRGRCAEAGVRPDVLVGTLGKSLGSQGAFVAGRAVLKSWLWNRARSFVFSTGLSPRLPPPPPGPSRTWPRIRSSRRASSRSPSGCVPAWPRAACVRRDSGTSSRSSSAIRDARWTSRPPFARRGSRSRRSARRRSPRAPRASA